ncbi:MAG TPA: hypothetical protein VFV32_05160 [Acidimicrobiales bacterium]|jgi:hypothetical protein|nr:hypothetical protein [Acidimicrobiales bacterium]
MTEPNVAPAGPTFFERIGPRALRRAEPRASIAVAGAGCVLAVVGVLIVSGDTGATDGDFSRWPGVILSGAVVVAGYLVLTRVHRGAVATGAAVAAGLGVPPLMFFLTFDQDGLPPYSTEAILGVSAAAWLASYVWGPGRGRPFFLGAGLLALWAVVLQVTEELFDAPYGFLGGWAPASAAIGGDFGGAATFHAPDPTTLGVLSLALGVAYLVMGRLLDSSGHHGAATPVAAATLPVLATAPIFLADDLDTAGTGLLLVVLGLALAVNGAAAGRRTTTWVGGAAMALGVAVFLSDMTDDATVGGMLFLATGLALVFAGHVYAGLRHEPDEMAVTAPYVAATLAPVTPGPIQPDDSLWAPPPADDGPPPPPPPPPGTTEAGDIGDDTTWAPPPDDPPPPPA